MIFKQFTSPLQEVPDSKFKRLDTGKHLWCKSHHFRCVYTQHQSRTYSLQPSPQDQCGGKAQAHNYLSEVVLPTTLVPISVSVKSVTRSRRPQLCHCSNRQPIQRNKYTAITIRNERDDTNHRALKVIRVFLEFSLGLRLCRRALDNC